MATKEDRFSLKQSKTDHSFSDENKKFLNFNLTHGHRGYSNDALSFQSNSKSNNGKHFGNTVTDNYQESKKSWNKSTKDLSLKSSKNLKFFDNAEKEEKQKHSKTDKKNSSTLSLHIAAYENSDNVSNGNEDFQKKSKTSKFVDTLSKFETNRDFLEFPRQMDGSKSSSGTPEVQQFKTSQKLFSPNQGSSSSLSQPHTSPKSPPRTSQCSTASAFQSGSASSATTATLPSGATTDGTTPNSTLPSFSGISSLTRTPSVASVTTAATPSVSTASVASSTTTNSSAFSVIGKTLSRLIQNCYAGKKPIASSAAAAGRRTGSKGLVQKRLIRKRIAPPKSQTSTSSIITGSTSSMNAKRDMQKWVFTCKGCSRPITRDDVRANNAMFAMDSAWHRSHLVCMKCSANIGDEIRPFIAAGPEEKKRPLCLDCYMEAEHPTCTACHLPLFETCIEIDEKRMHQNCFVCERCKAPFEGGKYAMINDKPYDLDCYYFKAYEHAFAPTIPGSFFDLNATSPPPMAESFLKTASDSATSLPSPPAVIENETYFKKKTTEFVSLCDVGHPQPPPEKSKKDLSAEIFETDHIKYPLKSPPRSDGPPPLDLNSKEKATTPPSKEKATTPPASLDLNSKEKAVTPPAAAAAEGGGVGSGESKKADDSKKEENNKDDKSKPASAATESSTPPPHPDSYAAAVALPPHSVEAGAAVAADGGNVGEKKEVDDSKKDEKKEVDDSKKDEKKEDNKDKSISSPAPPAPASHHPDSYAAAAALTPLGIVDSTVVGEGGEKKDIVGSVAEQPPKIEEKKDDKSSASSAVESSTPPPHPDTYAAAAAAASAAAPSVDSVGGGENVGEKKADNPSKPEEKKDANNN